MADIISQDKIRNIAIIAHVDHGKTTLVDAFLKQANLFRDNQDEMNLEQILDSGELEREKGITIKAKNVSIRYKDYKINIVDTPGHADFGGEVERTLNMAEGCLLIIDAQEGPMPQTEFVLKRALELKLKPIVVINKIDKKYANVPKVLDKLHDLFLKLATETEQLDFPVFYAIAREGKIFSSLPSGDLTIANSTSGNLELLLDSIVNKIPPPPGDREKGFQMQINALDFDSHLGRILVGKIYRGKVRVGDSVIILSGPEEDAKKESGKVKKILVKEGLDFVEIDEVGAGDIAAIVGIESMSIGGTICSSSNLDPLPKIQISPPAVKIKFEANTSPLVGKEGKYVTATQLEQRLETERTQNISLQITKAEDGGGYLVAGRGELQLSILIETMRREGYEFQVRKPEVIIRVIDGKKFEPLEELFVDTVEEYIGTVSEELSKRKAEMISMETGDNKQTRMVYKILTKNLFGLRSRLLTNTKGNIVLNHYICDYIPFTHQPPIYRKGVLIASDPGVAAGYSLNTVQERGDLFITPSTQVYEGMIIGINKFDQDLDVNVTKERQKSGVRIKHDEITQTDLRPPIPLTLEFALVFIAKDELLEVTPKSLRLRKQFLTKNQRVWSKRENLTEWAKSHI